MRTLSVLLLVLTTLTLVLTLTARQHASAADPVTATTMPGKNLQQATFAAGCFWGVEENFRRLKGVVATAVGYSGGHTKDPTYQDVCTDLTGHAESVLVTYDPAQISYPELLDAFWSLHDPTTKNRQGPDIGTQYRSVIFFHTPEQEKLARASMKEVDDAKLFKNKIVTEIVPAAPFYKAEDYHQQYVAKTGAVCHLGPVKVTTKLAQEGAAARTATAQPK